MIDHDLRSEKCRIISVHQREFYYMPVTRQKSEQKNVTCLGSFIRSVPSIFPLLAFVFDFCPELSKDSNFSTSKNKRLFIVSLFKGELLSFIIEIAARNFFFSTSSLGKGKGKTNRLAMKPINTFSS